LDKVMFVVNGLPPRLMVVNTKTGAVEVNHELPLRPVVRSEKHSRTIPPGALYRAGNVSPFLPE
jgi:hypothetical protein